MTLQRHLAALDFDDLADAFRYWAPQRSARVPAEEEQLRERLGAWMAKRERVVAATKGLPPLAERFLAWLVERPGHRVGQEELESESEELPIWPDEVGVAASALTKRALMRVERSRDWKSYDQVVYEVPPEIAEGLQPERKRIAPAASFTLKGWMRVQGEAWCAQALAALDLDAQLARDPLRLQEVLCSPESFERQLLRLQELLGESCLCELVRRIDAEQGGVAGGRLLEQWHGAPLTEREGQALEGALLGTRVRESLDNYGIALRPGDLVLFLDLSAGRQRLLPLPEGVEEPPGPPDPLAELDALHTDLDHHSVRTTREGRVYQSSRRALEERVLGPGHRPDGPAGAIDELIAAALERRLLASDADGRLRTTTAWAAHHETSAFEKNRALFDALRGVQRRRAPPWWPELERALLALLRELVESAEPRAWFSLRAIGHEVRNRTLESLAGEEAAARFLDRFKHRAVPAPVGPARMAREAEAWLNGALVTLGYCERAGPAGGAGPVAWRPSALLRTALRGQASGEEGSGDAGSSAGGALIATADFELIVFPDRAPRSLVHDLARFARREKADRTIHFRLCRESVQEGVARGLQAREMVELLRTHSRHPLPQNMEAGLAAWAEAVRLLRASRSWLVEADSAESLDRALAIPRIAEIAGRRLGERVLELTEDPSLAQTAKALRELGFFLT